MPNIIKDEIRYATFIRSVPERVYDALTTAQGLDGWFTTGATVNPKIGGEIHFRWKEFGPDKITTQDRGIVLEARRSERFVFQWHPDNPSYVTTVEINFVASEVGTVVRLREHGYHETASGLRAMLDCASSWGEALTLLKFYIEHGIKY